MHSRWTRRIVVAALAAALLSPAFAASAAPGREPGLYGALADRLLGLLQGFWAFSTSETSEEDPPQAAVPADDGSETTTGNDPVSDPQLGPELDPDG